MLKSVTTLSLAALFCIGAVAEGFSQRLMENLGRGVVAIRQGGDVFISWRMLGTDPDDVRFNVYRASGSDAPTKLNGEPIAGVTFFIDKSPQFAKESRYTVRPVVGGTEREASAPFTLAANSEAKPYLTVPLQVPADATLPDGVAYPYSAGDCSIGDLDGDGEYEIIVKWEANPKDNSHSGYTGNVFLDAYKLDGTRLWRIDLGVNIRAGAHYTQFMVYDLDGDGKAEVACKTGDGTTDSKGKVIGNAKADHRNKGGYILEGPEYLTVFDGLTGAELVTTEYIPPRSPHDKPSSDELKQMWGDGYGNRMDRFLACIAYLDGVRPSLVMCRGYYTRTVLAAWDWRDGKLTKRWVFDSDEGGAKNKKYAGQGNHNLSVADVDGDGKDEIVYGGMCLDDDGKGLWTSELGHGDAMHVTDHDPTHPGLEVFRIQERFGDAGAHMFDAKTGDVLWKKPSVSKGSDGEGPGRGLAIDIDPRTKGSECWVKGAGIGGLFDCKGNLISEKDPPPCNFGVWWDGDLLRELLDRTWIAKWNWKTSELDRILTAEGCSSNNGTKATPGLSGDILGDWREEVVWRTEDSKELRIYTTTIPTEHRFPTLMHDPEYRLSIAWQNVSYNQPPHTSFYLGDGMAKPPRANITTTLASAGAAQAKATPASRPKASPPPAEVSTEVQKKLKALVARRKAEEARGKVLELEGQPGALLVLKTADGNTQLIRAKAVSTNDDIVAAEMPDGTKGVWQKQFVAEQLPVHTQAELQSGTVDVPALLERYEAVATNFPELREGLQADLLPIRKVVAAQQAIQARFEALSQQKYDPTNAYDTATLETLLVDAELLKTELPDKSAEIDALVAPFRTHLENVLAGRVLMSGNWITPEEVEAERLAKQPRESTILTQSELLNALKVPLAVLGGLLLVGLLLAFPRPTRSAGMWLLVLTLGGAALILYLASLDNAPPSGSPEGADKVLQALVAGSGRAAKDAGNFTLTAADIDAFAATYAKFEPPGEANPDLRRIALSVELAPGTIYVRERVSLRGQNATIRYELRPSADGANLVSVKIGKMPVPPELKSLLWQKLSAELARMLQPGVDGLQPVRVDQDAIELARKQ